MKIIKQIIIIKIKNRLLMKNMNLIFGLSLLILLPLVMTTKNFTVTHQWPGLGLNKTHKLGKLYKNE